MEQLLINSNIYIFRTSDIYKAEIVLEKEQTLKNSDIYISFNAFIIRLSDWVMDRMWFQYILLPLTQLQIISWVKYFSLPKHIINKDWVAIGCPPLEKEKEWIVKRF